MITSYDAVIYDAVDTAVEDYCDGYYEATDEMMDYLKDNIFYSIETDSFT